MSSVRTPRPAPSNDGAGRFRVLILRSGALGDFVLTLPVLGELRRLFPGGQIVYGGRATFGALAVAGGLADRCVQEDAPEIVSLFAGTGAPIDRSRDAFGAFGFAVSMLGSSAVAANLIRCGVVEACDLNPLPPATGRVHAADHLVSCLRGRCGQLAAAVPRLTVPEDVGERSQKMLESRGIRPGRFLLVHPGSGSRRKNWAAERFAAVARSVRDELGLDVVVSVGPAEAQDESIRGALEPVATAWLVDTRLAVLSAVCAASACCLGNDSGVSHLAAASGAPTVAIFGPTDPGIWGPRGEVVRIVRSPSGELSDIEPADVVRAVRDAAETRRLGGRPA